jgi:hypothetical protein
MAETSGQRLSVGFQRGVAGRVVSLAVATAFLVPLTAFVGGIVGGLTGWLFNRSASIADLTAYIVGGSILVGGAIALLMSLAIARVVRWGAWLDGTALTVRALRSRTVDLADARSVSLVAAPEALTAVTARGDTVRLASALRTPVLTVVTSTGSAQLRLRSRDGLLVPPNEMLALAFVLAQTRCPGAQQATAWLRTMAADPRSLLT